MQLMAVMAYLTLVGAQPVIPDVPKVLACPMFTDTSTEVTLNLKTDDPKKREVAYLVDWGDGTMPSWSRYFQSGIDIDQYYTYHKPGTMIIRVRVKAHAFATPDTTPSEWCVPCTLEVKSSLIKWKFPIPDGTLCSPALDSLGNLYFGDEAGHFYSLTADGKLRWQFQAADTDEGAFSGAPLIGNGVVYLGCEDMHVYALSTSDGKLIWSYRTALPVYSAPVLSPDGMLCIADDSGVVYCLNNQGILRWTFATNDQVDNGLTVGPDGTIYVPSDSLYALSGAGKRIWAVGAQEEDNPFYGVGIGPEGDVYATNMDGYVYHLDRKSGRIIERIRSRDEEEVHTEAAFGPDNTMYFGSDDYYLNAWKPGDSTRVLIETDDHVRATPAISSKGTIYCLSMDGNLYSLTPTGRVRWQKQIGSIELEERWIPSSPVIAPDGTVYIGSFQDGFYAFYGDAGPLNGKWSMFRGNAQHTAMTPKAK